MVRTDIEFEIHRMPTIEREDLQAINKLSAQEASVEGKKLRDSKVTTVQWCTDENSTIVLKPTQEQLLAFPKLLELMENDEYKSNCFLVAIKDLSWLACSFPEVSSPDGKRIEVNFQVYTQSIQKIFDGTGRATHLRMTKDGPHNADHDQLRRLRQDYKHNFVWQTDTISIQDVFSDHFPVNTYNSLYTHNSDGM